MKHSTFNPSTLISVRITDAVEHCTREAWFRYPSPQFRFGFIRPFTSGSPPAGDTWSVSSQSWRICLDNLLYNLIFKDLHLDLLKLFIMALYKARQVDASHISAETRSFNAPQIVYSVGTWSLSYSDKFYETALQILQESATISAAFGSAERYPLQSASLVPEKHW